MATAQVHRFLDTVGVYVGTGETVYLSAKAAKELAKALNKAARSVDTEPFAQSTCGTFQLVLTK